MCWLWKGCLCRYAMVELKCFKGHLLCPLLQDVIRLSCPQNVSVNSQLKIPHRSFIISFKNAFFEWKQKPVFVHVSLNANELLLPTPFSRIGLLCSWYRRYTAKKHVFGFDYHVYCAEIMQFKPYQFKLLIHAFLSVHIRSTHRKRLSHSMWVLN